MHNVGLVLFSVMFGASLLGAALLAYYRGFRRGMRYGARETFREMIVSSHDGEKNPHR